MDIRLERDYFLNLIFIDSFISFNFFSAVLARKNSSPLILLMEKKFLGVAFSSQINFNGRSGNAYAFMVIAVIHRI